MSLVQLRGTLRMPSIKDAHPIVYWADGRTNGLQISWPDGSEISATVLRVASITLEDNPNCPLRREDMIAALTAHGCTVTITEARLSVEDGGRVPLKVQP